MKRGNAYPYHTARRRAARDFSPTHLSAIFPIRAYSLVVKQWSPKPPSQVRVLVGPQRTENPNCFGFSALRGPERWFFSRRNREAGSRNFLSDDEQNICGRNKSREISVLAVLVGRRDCTYVDVISV